MTRSHTTRPGHARRWHRARGLAAMAVPLALAAGVLPASGTALAQPATPAPASTPTGSAGSADQQHTLQPLSLPGLHDDSYSVTLLTGDQVRLTATDNGHYSLVATPNAGHGTVTVNATGGPDGVTTVQATPSAAQFLIASGQVDKGLFDIQYLAAHGYTDNAGKAIPVTVQYTGHPDQAAITRNAGDLPASTLTTTNTQTGTADLRVDAHHVADFWAALTGATGTGSRSGLTDGIAHVWLTGHRTSDQPTARPDAGEPTYPVTLTITIKPDELFGGHAICHHGGAAIPLCTTPAALLAVDGDDAGYRYSANWECVNPDPCTTMRAWFAVPAGTYSAVGQVWSYVDANKEYGYVFAPEVEVNGPADVEFDLSRLQHVDINTPKPTETFNSTVQWQRTLPDGRYATSFVFTAYGRHSIWALPTDQPVTLGSFHLATAWVLGKPPVTAHVDGRKGFDLHPTYSFYNARGGYVLRFSGRQRLQVVDAGDGQAEDFAAIDARGKLAIMHPHTSCYISKAQLNNALKAGAAGVLFDPRGLNAVCTLPIYYENDRRETPPDMPFAAIPPSEATRLKGLLGHGDVRVTVTDGGVSPYAYNLKFYEEGGIPRSLHYDIGADQLTAVDTRYHADTPGIVSPNVGVWRPDEYLIGGLDDQFAVPARRIEYYGPVAPDLVVNRAINGSLDVFDQRDGNRTESWFARPAAPSPATPRLDVLQAQPGKWTGSPCSFCRQGNYIVASVDHLYRDGEEIPQTTVHGVPGYELPPDEATYRMVWDYANQGFGHTNAEWTFTSSEPTTDQTPPGTICPLARKGLSDEPCRADPIMFLNYDLGVALDNTLTAPSVGRFTVTASHQATDAPAIRDLKVWTSTDDGAHWKQALVLPRGRGGHGARDFSVLTGLPWLSQTTGTLSIRAQATDAQGNSITETLTQAVRLTQGSGRVWPGHRMWQ